MDKLKHAMVWFQIPKKVDVEQYLPPRVLVDGKKELLPRVISLRECFVAFGYEHMPLQTAEDTDRVVRVLAKLDNEELQWVEIEQRDIQIAAAALVFGLRCLLTAEKQLPRPEYHMALLPLVRALQATREEPPEVCQKTA
jgi:hypothetical protein